MPFVIIGSPRTGSTHLISLLHRQPGIICHGELFHPKRAFLGRWRSTEKVPETAAQMAALRDSDPMVFLERIFANAGDDARVGFKIFRGHNDGILDRLIADSTVKKIILFRRNMLAVYSSSRIAHSTGRRASRISRGSQPTVEFEPPNFVKFCRRYAGFYRDVLGKLNATNQDYHLLHYDEINDSLLFARLLNFIGANSSEIRVDPRLVKLNSPDILTRFSNAEVAEEFLRTNGLMEWTYETAVSLDPFPAASSPDDADPQSASSSPQLQDE